MVSEIMTSKVKSCGADTDLAAVAKTMWDCDCGVVPVIDDTQRVIGIITDRDICIASATRSEAPAQLRAHEVMAHGDVHACAPDDDVRTALRTMKRHRVRRLPVLDRQQRLLGILSLNDLVVPLSFRDTSGVPGEEFIDTLRAISLHTTTRPVSE
jgi:CBS domain-containing protein